eukprot:IDg13383t1
MCHGVAMAVEAAVPLPAHVQPKLKRILESNNTSNCTPGAPILDDVLPARALSHGGRDLPPSRTLTHAYRRHRDIIALPPFLSVARARTHTHTHTMQTSRMSAFAPPAMPTARIAAPARRVCTTHAAPSFFASRAFGAPIATRVAAPPAQFAAAPAVRIDPSMQVTVVVGDSEPIESAL